MDGITDPMDMSLSKFWEFMIGGEALACCRPWGHKELGTTVWLNNNIMLTFVTYNKCANKGGSSASYSFSSSHVWM